MKNDIKKYLTLGAALAGSAFMVSCDGDDGTNGTNGLPAPVVTSSLSKIVSNDASFNNAVTATDPLILTFTNGTGTDDINSNSVTGATGWATTADPIEAGDTLDLGATTGSVTYSGVTSADGVITVTTLDVTIATEDEFSDLILTETTSSEQGSILYTSGTFTMNAEILEDTGTLVTHASGTPLNNNNGVDPKSAGNPGTFPAALTNSVNNALESVVGDQPTVTIGTDVFTVAVGDTLFFNDVSGNLYVTDTASSASSIPGSPATNDLTVTLNVAAGNVVQLVSGTTAAKTIALTGTFESTVTTP